jgi:hypothetical protein
MKRGIWILAIPILLAFAPRMSAGIKPQLERSSLRIAGERLEPTGTVEPWRMAYRVGGLQYLVREKEVARLLDEAVREP